MFSIVHHTVIVLIFISSEYTSNVTLPAIAFDQTFYAVLKLAVVHVSTRSTCQLVPHHVSAAVVA